MSLPIATSIRHFAVIPAAGHGRRLGGNKLLLPWDSTTIIDQVIRTWTQSRIDKIVVVVRRDDDALANQCSQWPVEIVRPHRDPRDMKESIQHGLLHLSDTDQPRPTDRWLVAPADLPNLSHQSIDRVISATIQSESINDHPAILVPRYGQRRGHPVSFPWSCKSAVFQLSKDEGIDRLLKQYALHFVELPNTLPVDDVDTPEDYQQQLILRSVLANHAGEQKTDESKRDRQP